MQEIDHAIKVTITLKPDCLLDLIFGSQRLVKLKELTDAQINIPELRADKMLLVEEGEKQYYILCEAMLQPDASALPIFALKALGHQYLLNKPTLVVIVYLTKGDYATFPDSFENSVRGLSNQFKLQRILLWEHIHRILNGELKEFLPFLALLYEQPDPSLMDEQKNLLSQITDPKLQADLLTTTIIVNIRTFGREVVLAKFKKEVIMLKDTSLVQGWITEGRQEGWQEGQKEGWQEGQKEGWQEGQKEGWQEGQKEGWQKGQKEGKLVVLESILIQKFGALAPSVLLKLQSLGNEQLDRLTLALLNISSREELQTWLANGVNDSAKN